MTIHLNAFQNQFKLSLEKLSVSEYQNDLNVKKMYILYRTDTSTDLVKINVFMYLPS